MATRTRGVGASERIRACLVTKMAEALHDSATKQVSDILELLQTGEYCNTFSERGKRQTQDLQQFKEAAHAQGNEERFSRFCEDMVATRYKQLYRRRSVVCGYKREISYRLFYQKKISDFPKRWDEFHEILHLQKPDPL